MARIPWRRMSIREIEDTILRAQREGDRTLVRKAQLAADREHRRLGELCDAVLAEIAEKEAAALRRVGGD